MDNLDFVFNSELNKLNSYKAISWQSGYGVLSILILQHKQRRLLTLENKQLEFRISIESI